MYIYVYTTIYIFYICIYTLVLYLSFYMIHEASDLIIHYTNINNAYVKYVCYNSIFSQTLALSITIYQESSYEEVREICFCLFYTFI